MIGPAKRIESIIMELYKGAFHAVSAPIISDVKCPIDRDLRQFCANETTFLSQRSWINRRSAPHLAFPSARARRAPLTLSFHVRKSSDLSSLIFTSTRQSEQRTHTIEPHVFDSPLKEEISKATSCNQTFQWLVLNAYLIIKLFDGIYCTTVNCAFIPYTMYKILMITSINIV